MTPALRKLYGGEQNPSDPAQPFTMIIDPWGVNDE